MKIAIDAMGGDNAPEAIVEGTLQAAKEFLNDEFILYGSEEAVRPLLKDAPDNVRLEVTTEVIETGDEPVKAVRRKKDSSMVRGARAVKKGEADALLSSGNSGALLTVGTLLIGRLKGIQRPGFLVHMPVVTDLNKVAVLVDAGANADSKPLYLWQNAIMASSYLEKVHGITSPRVALLNNGVEEDKGSSVTKEAYQLLKQDKSLNFIGNMEARDVLNDVADVIVADGFTGNAVIKTIEGTVKSLMFFLKDTLTTSGLGTKLGAGLIQKALKEKVGALQSKSEAAGLVFGITSPVLKTHGSATSKDILGALRQAHSIVESGLYQQLQDVVNVEQTLKSEED